MKTYDLFSGEDLKIADKILQRRLQMLVHSCIYYHLDSNSISDMKWDEWAKELLALQKNYPEISKQVDWYDAFADWDASTGAFLPITDPWVVNRAKKLLGSNLKIWNVSQNRAKAKSLFNVPVKTSSTQALHKPKTTKKSLF